MGRPDLTPRKYEGRAFHFVLGFSQLLNVVAGSGFADEAFSAYASRQCGARRRVVNCLFFWQDDHCKAAYESELARAQLPTNYRKEGCACGQ